MRKVRVEGGGGGRSYKGEEISEEGESGGGGGRSYKGEEISEEGESGGGEREVV